MYRSHTIIRDTLFFESGIFLLGSGGGTQTPIHRTIYASKLDHIYNDIKNDDYGNIPESKYKIYRADNRIIRAL